MQKNTSLQLHNPCSISSLQALSLDEIQRNIALSSTQLLELAHRDDKLYHCIRRLNELGLTNIRNNREPQALAYFNQCQRILEYAASCGTTIDRSLIIAVLNNQALYYQKINDIETAYNYLEAILYNLRLFLDGPQNIMIQAELQRLAAAATASPDSQRFIQDNFQELKSMLQRKQQLSVFYLRFSGLNSLRQLHSESLRNAKQSLKHMKQLCKMCYQFQRITTANNPHVKMLLKQLSTLDEELIVENIGHLRKELSFACCGVVDNNKVFRQAFDNLSQVNKREITQADVHSLFDLEPIFIADNVLEDQSRKIELCLTYFMQLKKILFIMGAYFAIAVETQQLENQQIESQSNKRASINDQTHKKPSLTAEMAHLCCLITGFTYLPNSKLTNYFYSLFSETYPSALELKDSPAISMLLSEALQPNYRTIESNMNQLKEKYKNYIIEKEMDLSQSASHREHKLNQVKSNWEQEKKESKKLNQLLKQEAPMQTHTVPNQYLNEVQYIDSFQMANSRSATQNSISIGIKTAHCQDGLKKQKKKKQELKQITQCQSQVLEQTKEFDKMTMGKFSAGPTGMLNENWGHKKVKDRGKLKSKSVKIIKSKSKDIEQKQSARKNISIYTKPSLAIIPNSREKAQKMNNKSRSPNRPKQEISISPSSQQKKLLKTEKNPFVASQGFKYSLKIDPLASMKANYQSIKFNKAKSPAIFDERYNYKLKSHFNVKLPKNSSKKSLSSKKLSSKSLSLAKSQNKQLQSTAKLKIYTSMNGWNKSKKQ